MKEVTQERVFLRALPFTQLINGHNCFISPHVACDSPDQEEHDHTIGLKLGTWHLVSLAVKVRKPF